MGHESFRLVAHDRGARVAYRLVLDHPHRVLRLALLDIASTKDAWEGFDARQAMGKFHWTFLAQPAPLPEDLIAAKPLLWLETLLADWSNTRDLTPFSDGALAHYRAAIAQAERIHTGCEDYRAGIGIDWDLDRVDRQAGRKIAAPTLVLWGGGRSVGTVGNPLDDWAEWCNDLRGQALNCGHFLPEEAPDETATLLLDFMSQA